MKKIIIFILGFIVGYFFTLVGCHAQTTYLYGFQGQSLGTVQQFGNSQYFYGPQGQNLGTAQQFNNTTYVYSSQGERVITVTPPVAPAYTPTPFLTPVYDLTFGK